MRNSAPQISRAGFTLIELSIVLVIIGLIVGGVLVGQDLIRAAEIRGTIAQIEKYSAAITTFRTKYKGLPGDLSSTLAAQFGMTARSGAPGHGDGNGYIESCGTFPTDSAVTFGCETALVWEDLSSANLVDGNFSTATDALTQINAGQQPLYLPAAKLGRGNYITITRSASWPNLHNHFSIGSITTDAAGAYALQQNITPAEAYAIDSKIDDGIPITINGGVVSGNVYPTNLAGQFDAIAAGARYGPGCVWVSVGPPIVYSYNLDPPYNDQPSCNLNMPME